jgi:Cys/Met metabolism PLP-dependent enzyme
MKWGIRSRQGSVLCACQGAPLPLRDLKSAIRGNAPDWSASITPSKIRFLSRPCVSWQLGNPIPQISRVRYPGLPSHPTHAVAKRVLKGFGTIISFEVVGGSEVADAVCRRTRLVRHATSLGGVESTTERRAAIPGQEHIPPSLLRINVGIEDGRSKSRSDSAMRSSVA